MKIVFVNAPFVRYKTGNPEKNKKLMTNPVLKLLSFTNIKLRNFKSIKTIINNLFSFYGLRFGVRAGSRWPWTMSKPHGGPPYPFIMGYAASYLKSKGFEVNLIDAIAENQYYYDKFIEEVKSEKPDIVVIECSTPTIDIDLWMAKEISKFSEVALAGPHLGTNSKKIKKENPHIKYILKGEYIKSSLRMAKSQKEGIYEAEVVEDLDSLPFPFRDYKSYSKYFDPTMPTKKPQLQIWGSKGCPFRCSFCLWPHAMYGGKFAHRDPVKIAEEIKFCVKKYGYKSIFFDDDTFNIGTERISKLCDELKKIGLPWTMMGRLDSSPSWLYDKMVNSGCVGMRFGVETFNQNVLDRVNKGLIRKDFAKTLNYLSKKYPKLMIHLTMMKNLPGQTPEIHKNDMEILRKMGFKMHGRFTNKYRNFQLGSCAPFPGTKLYSDLKKLVGEDKLKDNVLYDGVQGTFMEKLNKEINWNKIKD